MSPASVVLRIDVPAASSSAAHRRPTYISPAVTQMIVDMKQGGVSVAGYPKTVALTPTSGGCTSSLASTQCVLTVALLPGSYLATLETLDAGNNVLSTAQSIPVTVVAGVNNVVAMTLSGIPHAIVLLPKPSPLLLGNQAAGFALVGPVAQSFYLEAIDAGGNIILGIGAPTFAVAQTGTLGLTLTVPTATLPNTITVAPPATYSASAGQLNVTASFPGETDACVQPGAVCTASVGVTMQELVAVSSYTNDTVGIYAAGGGIPLAVVSTGVKQPVVVAFDKFANLFVDNSGSNTVTVYAPPYLSAPTATMATGPFPVALALDSSRDVFVANETSSTVQEFAPPYTGAAVATFGPANGIVTPVALAVDASGNVFVANNASVTVYSPSPASALIATVTTGISSPFSVAVDASANLFVMNNGTAPGVAEYSPPYSGAPVATITAGINNGIALTLDAASNLFVLNLNTNSVLEYAPPYSNPPIATIKSAGSFSETGLAIGPSGDLFIVNADTLAEYQPPYTASPMLVNGLSAPQWVAVAP